MSKLSPFGVQSTADQVLAGIDLTGKRMVVTGCTSGIGLETMNALTANGAHVFGLSRSRQAAAAACKLAGPFTTPVACDLSDLDSISAAAGSILANESPIDVIVANAGIAAPPALEVRYGIERQFLVNHIGHAALIGALEHRLRPGAARIIIVSAGVAMSHAPPGGIMFDNLDGARYYEPTTFYAQSKFANALYARELARRLAPRGIAVNSVNPGATRGTRLHRNANLGLKIALAAARMFLRTTKRGAATQALLAGSPLVEGVSGEHWENCAPAASHALLADRDLAQRLCSVTDSIVERHSRRPAHPLPAAA